MNLSICIPIREYIEFKMFVVLPEDRDDNTEIIFDYFIAKEIYCLEIFKGKLFKESGSIITVSFRGFYVSDPECIEYIQYSSAMSDFINPSEIFGKNLKVISELVKEVYPEIFLI